MDRKHYLAPATIVRPMLSELPFCGSKVDDYEVIDGFVWEDED